MEHLVSILNYLLMHGKTAKRYPADTSFVAVATVADVACPGYLSSIIGPAFGNRITRLSDDPDVQVNFPYPKTPSWNSDSSLLMLTNRLIDGRTYGVIAANAWWGDDEKKWSALAPHIYYAMEHTYDLDGDGLDDHVFVRRDVTPTLANGSDPNKERLITFSGADYDEVLLGKYEGNIDHQDRFVVFAARRKHEQYLTAIVYDIQARQVTTVAEMGTVRWEDDAGQQVLDWISVAPSGRFILLNWKKDPDNANPDYIYSIDQFDITMHFIRELALQGQHGDIGVDARGRDMYVQFEFSDRRGIWGYDLETGTATRLLPDKYNGGHISCRNYRRPGWCYPSTTQDGFREVFALKLDGSGTVNRFAQTHTSGGNSHGGVNADGTKIIFQSDWDGHTNNGTQEAFVVEVEQ